MSPALYVRSTTALIFLSFISVITLTPHPASAHVLKTDGSIEGILHVNPGHLPTAGEKASFEILFKDSKRSFAEGNYSVLLSVADAQGVAVMVPLTLEGTTAKGPYVFPHEGDYIATVTGISTMVGSPTFHLVYDDITALPPDQHESRISQLVGEHGGHILVTGLIVFIFLGVIAWEKYHEIRHKRRKRKNP